MYDIQNTKGIVIPFHKDRILLGRSDKGGFGYLGGSMEYYDSDVVYTASREFSEECKALFPINKTYELLKTVPKKYWFTAKHNRLFFNCIMVPWNRLSNIHPDSFIQKWNTAQPGMDKKYHEKVELKWIPVSDLSEGTWVIRKKLAGRIRSRMKESTIIQSKPFRVTPIPHANPWFQKRGGKNRIVSFS